VLYVGPEQESAEQILANKHGSVRYTRFLRELGEMVTLKVVVLRGASVGCFVVCCLLLFVVVVVVVVVIINC